MSPEQPIYNIGAAERLTGIPAATLRAWERRYQFPQSARTAGRHRLYSERQVASLRWVKTKIDSGMQTRQAIDALWQMEREERLTSAMLPPALPGPYSAARDSASYLAALQKQLAVSLMDNDVQAADWLFDKHLVHYPPEELIFQVIVPTFVETGAAWQEGRIGVSTEHMLTHYLRNRLMTWLHTGPPPYDVPPTVLACAPGELHEGSLLILGTLLRRRRWPIVYLGQSVPFGDLAGFIRKVDPLAIVLVAAQRDTVHALVDWPVALPQVAERGAPLIGFGGRIFIEQPEWVAKVKGVYLGDDLGEGVRRLESLLNERTLLT